MCKLFFVLSLLVVILVFVLVVDYLDGDIYKNDYKWM